MNATREDSFAPEVAAGIVAHMNDDHADAVLAIARAQGGAREATAATLVAITPRALDIDVVEPGGIRRARVTMDPPVAPLATVRTRLVEMTRAARVALPGPSATAWPARPE